LLLLYLLGGKLTLVNPELQVELHFHVFGFKSDGGHISSFQPSRKLFKPGFLSGDLTFDLLRSHVGDTLKGLADEVGYDELE
jgi:hypothetical protein